MWYYGVSGDCGGGRRGDGGGSGDGFGGGDGGNTSLIRESSLPARFHSLC